LNEKQTSKIAEKILLRKGNTFKLLSKPEKTNLAIALARKNMVIYGNAYDIVKSTKKIDFSNETKIQENLDTITIYEIKSTNRKDMKKDFQGYFFDLTTAEL
jgi:hypothetical protein